MVAVLLKILHSGIQDRRLLPPKGKPDISFFKKVLLKAGRFTTQWSRVDFDQSPDFGKSTVLTLPIKGQLISRMYLVATLPDIATKQLAAAATAELSGNTCVGPTFGWTNGIGHALVQGAQIDIGGTRFENLDSRLLEVMDEFNTPLEKTTSVNRLIHRYDNGFTTRTIGWDPITPTTVAVPLPFWFSRGDAGAFLPIDALNNDLVRLTITFAPLIDTYVSQPLARGSPAMPLAAEKRYPLITDCPQYQTDPSGSISIPELSQELLSAIPGGTMPSKLQLQDTYLMVEYIHLDKSEANRFRLADILLPVPQHYAFEPTTTNHFPSITLPLRIPNPTRDLYFFAQRVEAPSYNAHFLATRDLSSSEVPTAPWWPDASGLNAKFFTADYVPAFSTRGSEPISDIALLYEGKLVRYGTNSPAFFRSILPTFNHRKTPWVNRYYYTLSFGVENGFLPPSEPSGEANLDKIRRIDLQLHFTPYKGNLPGTVCPEYRIYCWAETYNIFRIYGGRAAIMFPY